MVSTVEMSEWECNTFHEYFWNLMHAMNDLPKVGDMDSQPDEFIIDDPSIVEHPRLQGPIEEHMELRNQFFRNASEALRGVNDDKITIEVLYEFARKKKDLFENQTILAEACSMAKRTQELTDEYLDDVHNLYTKFRDNVLPKSGSIKNVLRKLKKNDVFYDGLIEPEERVTKAMRRIRFINAWTLKEIYKKKDDFLLDVIKKAEVINAAYVEMYDTLKAQHSAQQLESDLKLKKWYRF